MSARSENGNAADIAETVGTSDFTARHTPQKRKPFGTAKTMMNLSFSPFRGRSKQQNLRSTGAAENVN